MKTMTSFPHPPTKGLIYACLNRILMPHSVTHKVTIKHAHLHGDWLEVLHD